MEVVYGPVSSWRLGRSLGVDPLGLEEKRCSFDCLYCSSGPTTEKTVERGVWVHPGRLEKELVEALRWVEVDVVTFCGLGEPTLARNLGELIEVARKVSGLPVVVLTNSSLMGVGEVRRDLVRADLVKGKLDAPGEGLFREVNRPHPEVKWEKVVEGMKEFGKEFGGEFAVEVMVIPQNAGVCGKIAEVLKEIGPDEVQVNTPLRPSPVRPLRREELKEVLGSFEGLNFRWVYGEERPRVGRRVGLRKLEKLKRVREEQTFTPSVQEKEEPP
ncbi:MAG: radical SAM protein [Candidatus Hadarchaeales archaeon]